MIGTCFIIGVLRDVSVMTVCCVGSVISNYGLFIEK